MKRAGKINKMSSRHEGRDWRRDPYGRLCTWHAPCCNWFPWDDRLSISVIMGTCGAFFPKGTWKRDDRFFADNSRWTLIGQQASEHHALAQWIINKGLIYSAWQMYEFDVWYTLETSSIMREFFCFSDHHSPQGIVKKDDVCIEYILMRKSYFYAIL